MLKVVNTLEKKTVNNMIEQWIAGNKEIENDLFKAIYPALKKIAHSAHQKIPSGEMQTTLLVNELYLKLKQNKDLEIKDENHLMVLSARIIRYLLVDNLRKQNSEKGGGKRLKITLNVDEIHTQELDVDWLTLHYLLSELEGIDPGAVELIELRFFAGLNIEETANVLNVSNSSVSRNWQFTKTWMMNKLNEQH